MDLKEIARELGRQGGEKTKIKYGLDHFKRIARLGVEARNRKRKEAELVQSDIGSNS